MEQLLGCKFYAPAASLVTAEEAAEMAVALQAAAADIAAAAGAKAVGNAECAGSSNSLRQGAGYSPSCICLGQW